MLSAHRDIDTVYRSLVHNNEGGGGCAIIKFFVNILEFKCQSACKTKTETSLIQNHLDLDRDLMSVKLYRLKRSIIGQNVQAILVVILFLFFSNGRFILPSIPTPLTTILIS